MQLILKIDGWISKLVVWKLLEQMRTCNFASDVAAGMMRWDYERKEEEHRQTGDLCTAAYVVDPTDEEGDAERPVDLLPKRKVCIRTRTHTHIRAHSSKRDRKKTRRECWKRVKNSLGLGRPIEQNRREGEYGKVIITQCARSSHQLKDIRQVNNKFSIRWVERVFIPSICQATPLQQQQLTN